MVNKPISNVNSNEEINPTDLSVPLSSMTKPLGRDHANLLLMFETFTKSLKYKYIGNQCTYKSMTYTNTNNRLVSSYIMTTGLAIAFAIYAEPSRGVEFVQRQEEELKLRLSKLKEENERLKLEASNSKIDEEKKLTKWQPLRWFLQESSVSGHLDKFTDRVNHREIRTEVFDREIKEEYSHLVKFNGKALIFNPEYSNEIKKILFGENQNDSPFKSTTYIKHT